MSMYDNSRYLRTAAYTRTGFNNLMLKTRNRFSFNAQNCTSYEWTVGDTLDGVAYRYYNESALRWAILDANPQYRTEFDIAYGDIILIPSYEEVVNIVNV